MTDLTPDQMVKMNPELAEILEAIGPVQFVTADSSITTLRAMGANSKPPPVWPDILENDRQVPMRDGEEIQVRIYTPKEEGQTAGRPLFVFYHGGGCCLGSIERESRYCRMFVREFGGVAVSVGYRLAPEFKFPTAVYDAFDALKWVATNWQNLGAKVNPERGFLVGGVSAGGTLTNVISHLYRDAAILPPLTGVFLSIISCVGASVTLPEEYASLQEQSSWEQNKDAPIIGSGGILFFESIYDPDMTSPLYSPVLFPTGHSNLPPAYFQICGLDPQRDKGLLYEKVMRREGIKTKIDLYPGLPHGFWDVWPKMECSKQQNVDSLNGLRWLLEQKLE